MSSVLLVDNYDSFTYNIAHLFGSLGADVRVVRNDDPELSLDLARTSGLTVIGPGPGRPEGAGKSLELIAGAVAEHLPLFGVCLGQQAIGEFFGGAVVHAPALMHGKVSEIFHDGTGVFATLPSMIEATRYHSLCVDPDDMPPELRVVATSKDGVVQAIAHRSLPIHAVQFHPESILTPTGKTMFANMMAIAHKAVSQ